MGRETFVYSCVIVKGSCDMCVLCEGKARQGEDEFCNTTCDINIIYFIMF